MMRSCSPLKRLIVAPTFILSAGGDGTLFQVLNGVLNGRENHQDLPLLGLIPLGSGNDFGRTIGASQDTECTRSDAERS